MEKWLQDQSGRSRLQLSPRVPNLRTHPAISDSLVTEDEKLATLDDEDQFIITLVGGGPAPSAKRHCVPHNDGIVAFDSRAKFPRLLPPEQQSRFIARTC